MYFEEILNISSNKLFVIRGGMNSKADDYTIIKQE